MYSRTKIPDTNCNTNRKHELIASLIIILIVYHYQHKLIKMRAELANLNHCAVPFLSRAAVNLCWYYIMTYQVSNLEVRVT